VSGTGHSLVPDAFADVQVANTISSLDTNNDGTLDTDDDHITAVDSSYYYTDLNMLVLAEDNSTLYSGIGGITKSQNSGAGISISVNVISRTTTALIGNEDYDLGDDSFAPGVGVDSTSVVDVGYTHGFSAGDQVTYTSGGDFTIAGLVDREQYYVNPVSSTTFTLARSASESTATFDPATAVNASLHTLNLGYTHGFHTGDRVKDIADWLTRVAANLGSWIDENREVITVIAAMIAGLSCAPRKIFPRFYRRFQVGGGVLHGKSVVESSRHAM
jgi:hypothetical protein